MRRLRRTAGQRPNRQGSIVVLAAVFLVVVIAFLAFSIDFGHIVVAESEMQNAADAGAMSGVRALFSNGGSQSDDDDDDQKYHYDSRAAAIAAAKTWAAKNTAAGESVVVNDEDVEIGRWDDDTATFAVIPADSDQSPNAVRVTCRRTGARGNPLRLFFTPVLGTDHANLTVSATARIKSSRCGLIIGLTQVTMSGSSHTDSYRSENGLYNATSAGDEGHVCSNGDIKMSGSTAINGNGHPGPDHEVNSSSSIGVTGSTSPLEQPISYPPADPGDAPWNNDNDSIPQSDGGTDPLSGSGEFKLSGGDAVDLYPGTYYFTKMSLSGGSMVRISGPTVIYVTGDCSLSGGSLANGTFLPKNLQLYPMGSKCVISGDSAFYGAVYAPTAKVVRSGSSDFYGSIVAGNLVLSGSGGIHADLSLDGQDSEAGLRRATLVQ